MFVKLYCERADFGEDWVKKYSAVSILLVVSLIGVQFSEVEFLTIFNEEDQIEVC